ncbi:hypothetical protein F4813DRAFT_171616 [Daldinia decipiens]|uniref:uncharacterized protein n=1 Tax=Daldinia decipiens TaxID=326647 RepID=UPI0020C29395|nr:uncharacterized protein F4813DRAFT_171616 [Daldinia decipiens]KAI1661737.1 hypothetical protein F4813DRAFT_171616 [Daldinia decipiens]
MPPPAQLKRSIPKWPTRDALLKRQKNHKFQPFEATKLILDLDAENSPYARPFSKKKDGEPLVPGRHMERSIGPLHKFVARLKRLSKNYQLQFADTASNKFDTLRITNYDILSVALRNPPVTRSSYIDYYVIDENSIFDQNGIPHYVLNSPSKTIAHMLHRQKISHRLEPTQDDVIEFRKAVKRCCDLDQIERVIMGAIRTPIGRWLIANSTNAIGRACVDMAGETPPKQMLTFLNNLIILLEPEKPEIPPLFLCGAILASVQCGVFDAAQRYIRMAKDSGVDFNVWLVAGILNALKTRSLEKLTSPSDIQKYPTYPLLAIYSLLTGQVQGQETPQPSLLGFISSSTAQGVYQGPYAACLARLGAFRTMWHFWHMHPVPPEDKDTSNADIFALAIHEAMLANHHLTKLAQAPSFTRVVGSYPDDCQLDIETIIESIEILSSPKPTSEVQFSPPSREAIEEIFGETSIEKSMLALQRYLSELNSAISLGEDID